MLQHVLGHFEPVIFPSESQVSIDGFLMDIHNPESMMDDRKLLDSMRTIQHLIQQDDIIAHIREANCIQGDDACFRPLTKELLDRISNVLANVDFDLDAPLYENDE